MDILANRLKVKVYWHSLTAKYSIETEGQVSTYLRIYLIYSVS